MLKKVLATVTLFSVSALGLSVANAAMPGVYVTGQLGYAQTHMKDKMEDLSSYLNYPIGFVKTDEKKNMGNDGFAGRLAIGYQFNCNFALEIGYLQLKQGKTGMLSFFHDPSEQGPSLGRVNKTLKQNAFDIAAKGIIPLSNDFNIYGKLGVAYLKSTMYEKGEKNEITEEGESIKTNIDKQDKWSQFAPEIVVGVSYALTPNVSLDTSLTHIHTLGKNHIGNIDFAALGLTYNFG